MKTRIKFVSVLVLLLVCSFAWAQIDISASAGFTGIYNNQRPMYSGSLGYNLGGLVSFEGDHNVGLNYEYINLYGDIYRDFDNDRIVNPTKIWELDYSYKAYELDYEHNIRAGCSLAYIGTFEYDLNNDNTGYTEEHKGKIGFKIYGQLIGEVNDYIKFSTKVGYFYAPVENEYTDHAFDLKGFFLRFNFFFRVKQIL